MDYNYQHRNCSALQALREGNFSETQQLLRLNVREYPCGETLHNLGVFYMQEGLETTSGRVRGAHAIGMHYLRRAERVFQHPLNFLALGYAHMEEERYVEAATYFIRTPK